MVLEISMYFEKTPIGILVPFPYLNPFHITVCYFLHSVYRRKCAEQNALGLRRRSLMVFSRCILIIGILVPFPYLIFFSHHTLLFFALYL